MSVKFSSRVRARLKVLRVAATKYLAKASGLERLEWQRVNRAKTALKRLKEKGKLKSQAKSNAALLKKYHTVTWYKWICPDGQPPIQGGHKFDLPTGSTPGKWSTMRGLPVVCQRGFHASIKPLQWKRANSNLYVVQVGGFCTPLHDGEKAAFTRLRVVRKVPQNSPEYMRVCDGSFTQKFKK